MSTTILRDCSKNIPHFVADSSVSPQGLKWAVDPVADVITTAGDLIYGTAADTVARLGIGTAGQVLKVNSGATAPEWGTVAAGGGKVLQVVSATTSTQANSSSTSFADTNLTATITPSLATSKVLVLMTQNGVRKLTNNTSMAIKLFRDATEIALVTADAADTDSAARNAIGTVAISYLDSPNTTSAVTYKTQFNSTGNSATTSVQIGSSVSSIVLMEIGA